ncbi:sigma-54-dependent transcriptional regulator [Desulfatirhabdium butyrativorans]|uniref:sigma-54-dependent transcriptional regulator n=1 Tax=Desulfatirhabdium butyrativorans TaxID=340467 RepID=UPI000405341A|nr:sigma-54 dependent transcriptional regulator [Desulfatirhabdium butyrativorans]
MKPADIGILIVDDEASVRDSLCKWFRLDGYRVDTADEGASALRKLQDDSWDIVLLDIKMPGMDGLELQRRIKQIDKDIVTIVMTAFASVDTSIQAMKEGAFDYIVKPIDPDDMGHLIRNAVQHRQLLTENLNLRQQLAEMSYSDEIVGESDAIRQVLARVATVAQTDSTVMIRGESGTGKELVAMAIHGNSNRRYFPMITINCGAYTEGLLESELFGHEKGAFTGAMYRRRGKLEMADKGTLFLDEIGNIGRKMQMDLLRVIESRQFTRLGGDKQIQADFRIISATNRDLEQAVREGSFREDLYYRLNVFSITLPPLRERKSDIPLIARFFMNRFARSMNKAVTDISPETLDMLMKYNWPGNIRELRNVIERAMVGAKSSRIDPGDLSFPFHPSPGAVEDESLEAVEKNHIQNILSRTGGNVSQAAAILKISRLTLYNKIEKYQLKKG